MKAITRLVVLLFALLPLAWPGAADALTTCTASSTPLAFGNATGTQNVDTVATITVTCSTSAVSLLSTVRVRMCLNIGDGDAGPGQYVPRRMTNPFGDPLQFQIYRDAARTLVWGSSTAPAAPTPLQVDFEYPVLVLGAANSTTHTMFARIPVQPGLASGAYSNPFTGTHTRLDYRYAEQLIGTPAYPASCTSGGIGGATGVRFPFTATANVPNHCSIASAGSLDFGSASGLLASQRDQNSTIAVSCTSRTAWNLSLNNGQNAVGNTRRMRLGATSSHVAYELYRDPARTLRWGSTIGSDTASGTGTGMPQSLTVYGRVPAPQTVPAGNYRDVVTVTVTY